METVEGRQICPRRFMDSSLITVASHLLLGNACSPSPRLSVAATPLTGRDCGHYYRSRVCMAVKWWMAVQKVRWPRTRGRNEKSLSHETCFWCRSFSCLPSQISFLFCSSSSGTHIYIVLVSNHTISPVNHLQVVLTQLLAGPFHFVLIEIYGRAGGWADYQMSRSSCRDSASGLLFVWH